MGIKVEKALNNFYDYFEKDGNVEVVEKEIDEKVAEYRNAAIKGDTILVKGINQRIEYLTTILELHKAIKSEKEGR